MRMISPQLDAPQVTVAEHQEEYKPVVAALVTHPGYGVTVNREFNTIVTCWRLSDEERQRLVAGADLYLSQLTFGTAMQAVILSVGAEEPAAIYGVAVTAPDVP